MFMGFYSLFSQPRIMNYDITKTDFLPNKLVPSHPVFETDHKSFLTT